MVEHDVVQSLTRRAGRLYYVRCVGARRTVGAAPRSALDVVLLVDDADEEAIASLAGTGHDEAGDRRCEVLKVQRPIDAVARRSIRD